MASSLVLLNAFDVDPGTSDRTLEVCCGDLFSLGLQADLLVVSAFEGNYDPVPKTLIGHLFEACQLDVGHLPRALDLTQSPVKAWVTPPLQSLAQPPVWPEGSTTRFSRLAVVESPKQQDPNAAEWPAFNQMFCLLALLPLYGIDCPTVAAPLLSAGNQGIAPERVFPALLDRCRDGFRHVPDLERLIIFDRQQAALEALAQRIDSELRRSPGQRQLLSLEGEAIPSPTLLEVLRGFGQRHPQLDVEGDLGELLHQLNSLQITAVALGMHGRRIAERLVKQRLGWRQGTLYKGIQVLSRQEDIDPWLISCLHQVRVFGNWMGHPSRLANRREVTITDVIAMLAALQRILEDYPWKS